MRRNVLTAAVFVLLIGLFAFAANDWTAPWTRICGLVSSTLLTLFVVPTLYVTLRARKSAAA